MQTYMYNLVNDILDLSNDNTNYTFYLTYLVLKLQVDHFVLISIWFYYIFVMCFSSWFSNIKSPEIT